MELKIKKLHPDAKIPTYGSDGAACFDLYSLNSALVRDGYPAIIRTGIAVEIPAGQVMKVYSRSGHGFKNNVRLANSIGIVDQDFRGEVMVKLTADTCGALVVMAGDRIAQAMLVPVERVTFAEVDDLSATERGTGGFGSTGA